MTLIFHTFLRTFEGETPEEIIDELHIESAAGNPKLQEREAWWAHQIEVLSLFNIVAPPIDAPDANRKLLEAMVSAGAVEEGPLRTPGLP